MTYSKKFFLYLAIFCASVFVSFEWLLMQSPLSAFLQYSIIGLLVVCVAIVGRLSNTLAEKFSKLFGYVMLLKPVITGGRLLLRRDICDIKEIEEDAFRYDQIVNEIQSIGVDVKTLSLDMQTFNKYIESAKYRENYPDYYRTSSTLLLHKQIQHYISIVLFPISGSEVWLDVAASKSPFSNIVKHLYGIKIYSQDISYPEGVHGLRIGSDAAAIPLPDSSVDRAVLHCSFEHFEGDADIGFIYELGRILKPAGVAVIVPLYLSRTYRIVTNPVHWLKRGLPKEVGAQITLSKEYWESHGRFYDIVALQRRIFGPLKNVGLDYWCTFVEIPPEVHYKSFITLNIQKP